MNIPCELVIKVGSNESEEISTTITNLLRRCSIFDRNFLSIEHQIHPTSYFGTFTSQSSISKTPIKCQSLSCVLLLPNGIYPEKSDCFKSIDLWRFHHKIELLNESKHVMARQDYFELSNQLPLWCVSRIPPHQQIVVRLNLFTRNFDQMLHFYTRLFQRPPNSSKFGFVLFVLPSNHQFNFQLSIKYSPSIEPYTISQGAHLKFRLNNLNQFIREYSRKLFTINPSEYNIYDPDGNLLHLHAFHSSSTSIPWKRSFLINDSGFGDTSEPSNQFLCSTPISSNKPLQREHDNRSHSSNDSGRWSSFSSNEINSNRIHTAKTDFPIWPRFLSPRQKSCKTSLYDSVPRFFHPKPNENRCYSSMNNFPRHSKAKSVEKENRHCRVLSYDVDSRSSGYLRAFLEKKRQEEETLPAVNVKKLVAQFEETSTPIRPFSTSIIDQRSKTTFSPSSVTPTKVKPFFLPHSRPKSATSPYESDDQETTSNTTDDDPIYPIWDQDRTPRINIGITLDSRLRKTPVLDMLRSTAMIEPSPLKRTHSLRPTGTPIARF